jgi:adenosylmethionine-8-amino-7-oxononanoate aminotransferase
VIVSDRIAAPFVEEEGRMYMHGLTFGGHPVSCAVALANLDILEGEDLCGNVLRHEELFDDVMAELASLPLVGDVRGCGYFRVAELVRDKDTRETFTAEESEWLLRGYLSPFLYRSGLICRCAPHSRARGRRCRNAERAQLSRFAITCLMRV